MFSYLIKKLILTVFFVFRSASSFSDLEWIPSSTEKTLPENALFIGRDLDNSSMYIGRTTVDGEQLVVKIVPNRHEAYISKDGREIIVELFDVLTGTGFDWIEGMDGAIHYNAIQGGKSITGEILYIGRGRYKNLTVPGKIHPSHSCLYFSFGGYEHCLRTYEILVSQSPVQWTPVVGDSIPSHAVQGGQDEYGSVIYIGRIYHGESLIPAKFIPSKNAAFYTYNGIEMQTEEVEVLCGENIHWQIYEFGSPIPQNAIKGGHNEIGEPYYIGRAQNKGNSLVVGKVYRVRLYITHEDVEIEIADKYEILVLSQN